MSTEHDPSVCLDLLSRLITLVTALLGLVRRPQLPPRTATGQIVGPKAEKNLRLLCEPTVCLASRARPQPCFGVWKPIRGFSAVCSGVAGVAGEAGTAGSGNGGANFDIHECDSSMASWILGIISATRCPRLFSCLNSSMWRSSLFCLNSSIMSSSLFCLISSSGSSSFLEV